MICAGTRNATVITEDISRYMNDIEDIPRISTKREIELSNLIHHGTEAQKQAAREELICANLKLVVKISHDFKRYGMTFADIVAEGNRGLVIAADKFLPGKGAKFSCYATWWIKQSIRKALAEQCHTIRIPGGATQKVLNLEKVKHSFRSQFNREPTDEELLGITGMSKKQLDNTKKADLKVYSIEAQISEDDPKKGTFGEVIKENLDDGSHMSAEVEAVVSEMLKVIQTFSDRDQWILKVTYGIGAEKLDEDTVCQETGLPVTRLHIRLRKLQRKLKEALQTSGASF
jgi:RNA polymerase primary sigma factor